MVISSHTSGPRCDLQLLDLVSQEQCLLLQSPTPDCRGDYSSAKDRNLRWIEIGSLEGTWKDIGIFLKEWLKNAINPQISGSNYGRFLELAMEGN